ncbi:MAG: hypothetical protein ACMG6E_02295, partial [Candidatus Roizmanbacteria bacterium]
PYADAYFGCYLGPVALTNDGILYIICGGGERQTLFKADLTRETYQAVTYCGRHEDGSICKP